MLIQFHSLCNSVLELILYKTGCFWKNVKVFLKKWRKLYIYTELIQFYEGKYSNNYPTVTF